GVLFFFFSSRRRHTRCYRDWSSDVCSSDLRRRRTTRSTTGPSYAPLATLTSPVSIASRRGAPRRSSCSCAAIAHAAASRAPANRSEERRVGKEGRDRGERGHQGKKEERERY